MTSISLIALEHVYITVFKQEIRLQMSEGHWSVHLHNQFYQFIDCAAVIKENPLFKVSIT